MDTFLEPCDVFLSYSRVDRAVVAPIAKLLRLTRTCIFRDEDSIPPGKRWEDFINESLGACHTVIVFWSVAAADSKSVAAEYGRAYDLRKDIVPVLLDNTPVAMELERFQWIDFREFVREGRNHALEMQMSAARESGAVMGLSWLARVDSYDAALYALLQKAQAGDFDVEWDDVAKKQIASLFSARIGRYR